MLTLTIEDKRIESIFLNEFRSNKENFFDFIQQSYIKMKSTPRIDSKDINFLEVQELSMQKTWESEADKVWDEL